MPEKDANGSIADKKSNSKVKTGRFMRWLEKQWSRWLELWWLCCLLVSCTWLVFQLVLIWSHGQDGGYSSWISIQLTYISLGLLITSLFAHSRARHKDIVLKTRLVDEHEIEAMMSDAQFVEPRVINKEEIAIRPILYEKKLKDLNLELGKLKLAKADKNEGVWALTEYQVLTLDQLLVEFLKADELITLARSRLEYLRNYAEGTGRDDYWEPYFARERLIDSSIETIKNTQVDAEKLEDSVERETRIDDACVGLRASLVDLMEHNATFDRDWAEGSAIIRGIILTGVISIVPLMAMGLLPILYAYGHGVFPCASCVPKACLFIYNWGFLGIAGAITAVLRSLQKSDLVEVGDTKGKAELWRAVLSAGLGLVAGMLAYSMIAGKLFFPGGLVPDINSQTAIDLGLSIVAAFSAGFFFESVFDKLKSYSIGSN